MANAGNMFRQNRQVAVDLMRHYLRESFNFVWEPDNDAEVAILVDAIINAAVWKLIIQMQEAAKEE